MIVVVVVVCFVLFCFFVWCPTRGAIEGGLFVRIDSYISQ